MNARLPPSGLQPIPSSSAVGRPQALVSVRSVDEALDVARAGIRLIDLKEPRDGALGALAPATVRAVVAALRAQGFDGEISATIGDHPASDADAVGRGIDALSGCGVDVIKVGVALPCAGGGGAGMADTAKATGPAARAAAEHLLEQLAARSRRGLALVPVLIVDPGLDALPWEPALRGPFHAVMLDTQDKQGGPLPERLGLDALARFVQRARALDRRCGLAGALRLEDWAVLARHAPADFLGFRSAVCAGDRGGSLDGTRLAALGVLTTMG